MVLVEVLLLVEGSVNLSRLSSGLCYKSALCTSPGFVLFVSSCVSVTLSMPSSQGAALLAFMVQCTPLWLHHN